MTSRRQSDAGKMSPEVLAKEVFRSMERDNYEIVPGRARLLLFLHRVAPSLIQAIVAKS